MLEPFDKYGRMDVDAFMDSFRPYLEANRRTTNTVFQVSLNPSPEDRLTDGQFRDIAQEYMERMGYGNQPYIVFKHKDISREHLHIVSLRVDEQGRKINDSHEYDQSMSVLRELERKYDLHPSIKGEELAYNVGLHRANYREGNVKTADIVRRAVVPAQLQMLVLRGVPHPAGTLQRLGRKAYGNHRRQKLRGYCLRRSDRRRLWNRPPFKSSKIGKDVGYDALQKYYGKSKAVLKEEGALDRLRQTVRDAMSPRNTRDEFRQLLKADGIDTIFRINPVGRIYGVTFIDHEAGIVADGSVLGKVFSANVFNELYPASAKEERHTVEQHAEQEHEVQNHMANPVSGIVDTLLDLADARAYEEQQRIRQRKRRQNAGRCNFQL